MNDAFLCLIDNEQGVAERCHGILERGIRRLGLTESDILNAGFLPEVETPARPTDETRRAICAMKDAGVSQREVARRFKTTDNTVRRIWRNVHDFS